MGFEFLPQLLTALPGTVVYHLLVFIGLLIAAGIVLTEWRHTRSEDLKPYLVTLGGMMSVRLLSSLLATVQFQPESALAILSAPFLYAGESLSVLLLVWAFGGRLWRARRWSVLAGIVGIWGALLLVATVFWYQQATGVPLTYTVHSWQVPAWYLLTALVAFGGIVPLRRTRGSGEFMPAALVLILLGVGALLGLLGSQMLGNMLPLGEGLGRFFFLVGYPLFSISLYSSALRDLETYRRDLKELSEEALRQSQELHFLIEATRSIGDQLDLGGMLSQVADSVAMAMGADTVAIFLTDEEDLGHLTLVALYQVLPGKATVPKTVQIEDYATLAFTLRQRQQLVFGPHEDLAHLRLLFELLDVAGEGPTLLLPLVRQDRVMGVLVACNDRTRAPFTSEKESLATTIGVQIAGAVENARLYGAVEIQAQKLRELLERREAELWREEAILESMAEGILVSDAEGRVIRLNQAAEEILGVDRAEMLGQMVEASLEQPALWSGFDLSSVLRLTQPFQTTFTLGERRIRVHAAPVHMEDGEGLGAVSILQDITREYLAEESKRGFIASISHELRTPLTAIKGYTEVMLSGMAGELPPAFSQFLAVIRENTTRMATLTNNIISVAEIERGRVGLNYRVVSVPDLVRETVTRYQERIEEHSLSLELDLPEDLPTIEVDPNRIRLVIDNLLSNAIKFTYPNGQITIGCQAIYGTLGQPTYFSVWISDTGVGIPAEEQLRIWERFYRATNPLSLEAGGLGIGLTIAKALVEAHGGRVWVDSTPGKGSTFTVLLPMERGQSLMGEVEVLV